MIHVNVVRYAIHIQKKSSMAMKVMAHVMKKKLKMGLNDSITLLQAHLPKWDSVDVALLAISVYCMASIKSKKHRKQACKILSRVK